MSASVVGVTLFLPVTTHLAEHICQHRLEMPRYKHPAMCGLVVSACEPPTSRCLSPHWVRFRLTPTYAGFAKTTAPISFPHPPPVQVYRPGNHKAAAFRLDNPQCR